MSLVVTLNVCVKLGSLILDISLVDPHWSGAKATLEPYLCADCSACFESDQDRGMMTKIVFEPQE